MDVFVIVNGWPFQGIWESWHDLFAQYFIRRRNLRVQNVTQALYDA